MFREPEVIRCEDCARSVPLAKSVVSEAGLICADCAAARDAAPPIFTPVWARLGRAFGISRKN